MTQTFMDNENSSDTLWWLIHSYDNSWWLRNSFPNPNVGMQILKNMNSNIRDDPSLTTKGWHNSETNNWLNKKKLTIGDNLDMPLFIDTIDTQNLKTKVENSFPTHSLEHGCS